MHGEVRQYTDDGSYSDYPIEHVKILRS